MASGRRHYVLIPAAGQSARFRAEGYSTPKPLLRVRYGGVVQSMLAHVISRVPREFVVVVGLAERTEDLDFRGEIRIVGQTSGQADTVLRLARTINPLDSVTVLDCDTLLSQSDVTEVSLLITPGTGYSAAVAVGYDTDPAMSRVDRIPMPTLFVEKKAISPWGMVSARAFSSAGKLVEALGETVREHMVAGVEPYLSEALNRYPGVKIAHVVTRWTDWGTPEKLHESGAEIVT